MGFGKRLRQIRERLGLSGAELAGKLGVKRTSIFQYESGRSFPSVSVLMRLSRFFGVTIDRLLFDEYESTGQIEDKELATYIAKADSLGYQERALIKGMIDGMLARAELDQIKRLPAKRRKVA